MIDLVINCLENNLSTSSTSNITCLEIIGDIPILCHLLETVKNTSMIKNVYVLLKDCQKEQVQMEMKRWSIGIEKPIYYIGIGYSVISPIFLANIMENDIFYTDLSFPFLSFSVFEWFSKKIKKEYINILIGNFKLEHFINTQKLYTIPQFFENIPLLSVDVNDIRFMNFAFIPFSLKETFNILKQETVISFILHQKDLKSHLLPKFFMHYEALPCLDQSDIQFLTHKYQKHNQSNSSMEFYYLWKKLEKLENKLPQVES